MIGYRDVELKRVEIVSVISIVCVHIYIYIYIYIYIFLRNLFLKRIYLKTLIFINCKVTENHDLLMIIIYDWRYMYAHHVVCC